MTPDPELSTGPSAPGAPAQAETRGMPAEVQYLIIVLAMLGLLLMSGVPGGDLPEAGNGTGVLRKGWAESWTEQVAASEADVPADSQH